MKTKEQIRTEIFILLNAFDTLGDFNQAYRIVYNDGNPSCSDYQKLINDSFCDSQTIVFLEQWANYLKD